MGAPANDNNNSNGTNEETKYITASELQAELEALASGLGISVNELLEVRDNKIKVNKEAIVAVESRMKSAEKRLDAIDVVDENDDVVTLAEKIKAINTVLSENGELAADLLKRIASNKEELAAIDTKIGELESGLADTNTKIDESVQTLKNNLESKYNDFYNKVGDAFGAAKREIDSVNENLGKSLTDINNKFQEVESNASDLEANIEAVKASVESTMSEVKSAGLAKGIISGTKAANKFRSICGLAPLNTDGSGEV